jgi:hypothetical protein
VSTAGSRSGQTTVPLHTPWGSTFERLVLLSTVARVHQGAVEHFCFHSAMLCTTKACNVQRQMREQGHGCTTARAILNRKHEVEASTCSNKANKQAWTARRKTGQPLLTPSLPLQQHKVHTLNGRLKVLESDLASKYRLDCKPEQNGERRCV